MPIYLRHMLLDIFRFGRIHHDANAYKESYGGPFFLIFLNERTYIIFLDKAHTYPRTKTEYICIHILERREER